MSLDPKLSLETGATSSPFKPSADEANRLRYTVINLYRLLLGGLAQAGIVNCSPARCVWDATNNRILRPSADMPIMGCLPWYPIYMDASLENSGSVYGATTLSLTDTGLTGTTGFWTNAYVVFTSGALAGEVRRVTAYDPATQTLSWSTPVLPAAAPGDTYVVTFFYVTGLQNSNLNYIFASAGSDTVERGIVEFSASLSGTAPTGTILLSTATLDSGGVCTAHDDNPLGCHRNLWVGGCGANALSGGGTVTGLAPAPAAPLDIVVTHEELLLCGDLVVTTDNANVTAEVIAHNRATQFTVRFTNIGAYSEDFSYTWERRGRLLQYG